MCVQNGTYGGVFFAYCYNLYVHNATFYYNFTQNPWYQATVTGISSNGQAWNITVSPPLTLSVYPLVIQTAMQPDFESFSCSYEARICLMKLFCMA